MPEAADPYAPGDHDHRPAACAAERVGVLSPRTVAQAVRCQGPRPRQGASGTAPQVREDPGPQRGRLRLRATCAT